MALNVVEIVVTAKNMTQAGFAEADASATAAGSKLSKVGALAAGVTAVGLYESAKAAINFNQQMERLVTQAGVAPSKLNGLKSGVLDLAGKVGFSPDSLAESLYHVASNMATMGASSSQMLGVVKVAAEGAQVGGANLVDVTNALTAAVASGIPGVQNYSQAMGMLNAVVGSGDMKMQDLADAFGSGMVATVKGFGLSLKDVGAALAVFGDNNIRGAKAGTDLRMSVMALAVPAKQGAAQLQQWGYSSDKLATDMRQGGLIKALDDLHGMFVKNGITAKEQGDVITSMFGKKAGAGLNVLMDQLDRLHSKYPAITKGAGDFGKAWGDTQKLLGTQLKQLGGQMEALAITIGEKLVPVVQAVVKWMVAHKTTVEVLIGVIGGLTAALLIYLAVTKSIKIAQMLWADATKIVAAAQWLLNFAMDANPIGLMIIGIAALVAGLVWAYTHFKAFRQVVSDVFDWIKQHWPLLLAILTGPIGLAVLEIVRHWHEIVNGAQRMWSDVTGWFRRLPGDILHALGNMGDLLLHAGEDLLKGLMRGIDNMTGGLLGKVGGLASKVAGFFGHVLGISSPSKVFEEHGRNIVAGLVQGIQGSSGQAVAAMQGVGLAGIPGGAPAFGGAGGGGWVEARLQLAPTGVKFMDELMEGAKLWIRSRGGGGKNSVQVALGQAH